MHRRPPWSREAATSRAIMAGARGGTMEHARFGRQRELDRISAFLDAVPAGPQAFVLGGEPGIGKSSLWLDALGEARARSYRALSSRPTEAEAKLSFAA